jgi:hypothetical protein
MELRILSLILGASVLNTVNAQSRVVIGQDVPWPPAKGTAYVHLTPPPGYLAGSLQELCKTSVLIVDGTATTVLPAREISPRTLETDVVFSITRVLKGPQNTSNVVVAQRGGTIGQFTQQPVQYSLIQKGERYILFLTEDKRPKLPQVPATPRFWITGAWVGLFRVNGSTIHLTPGTPDSLRGRYERVPVDQAVTEILAASVP